ncbi:MAG: AAA family ATPase [Bdellovibrionales bacterium]|nr:AAA family ATPase [Bdellovibrionales bacterium]
MPAELVRASEAATVSFDNAIYINKKAIDFIVENLNKQTDKRGKIKSADERIIHLADDELQLTDVIENVSNELLNYCELDGLFDLKSSRIQSFKSHQVAISNSCHFALFDKSDEALVNDYEELIGLLNVGGDLGLTFQNLLEAFLTQEPVSVTSEVDREWDEVEVSEKLVNISPIPLNEEQNQIIRALNKTQCKHLVVQGPPGTGKSHTITALVFNAILERKNVLVLSDKKEALDVVEDKITETLNNVRLTDEFQNPILRLGKAGNTYSKILSSEALSDIKNHFKAVSKNRNSLDHHVQQVTSKLKETIAREISEYSTIELKELAKLEELENLIKPDSDHFDIDELLRSAPESVDDLESLFQLTEDLGEIVNSNASKVTMLLERYQLGSLSSTSLDSLQNLIEFVAELKAAKIDFAALHAIGGLNLQTLDRLKAICAQTKELSSGLFGYLFKGKALAELLATFRSHFSCPEIVNLKVQVGTLERVIQNFDLFKAHVAKSKVPKISSDSIATVAIEMSQIDLDELKNEISELANDLQEVASFIAEFPSTASNLKIKSPEELLSSSIPEIGQDSFDRIREYLRLRAKLESSFKSLPRYDYLQSRTAIERLYTVQMTHVLDERVINFSENQSARAKTLKKIISSKKRFPKEEFAYLKEAFPCIIAGIRDYAEYIPLDAGLFDLVIIDEASQVSIAQALPAILRAKKVVVFGDKRQFSNIKSAQAKSEVNHQYLHGIRSAFVENRTPSASELERLSKFDIKTSVLDFFEYISNFNIMLKKHFRGYRELISYSSKYFYLNRLQAIKIRGKSIEDTIEFVLISHDGKLEKVENTNSLEADAILKYLERLLIEKTPPSVGIITPHTNQQKLIYDMVARHTNSEDFAKRLRLKVMTFDTCQGEERDIILYSMVANPADDKLGYIFIKSLKEIDFDDESKIKAQRLNVGFSRAKEKMVFFVSKPIDQFTGEIGEALRHYHRTLESAKSLPDANSVDSKSPMEAKVLQWIQETSFFKENAHAIELKTQFPIGEYLKQLDPLYDHPKYVCDFLLTFRDENRSAHHIVVEYDGFKEHFSNLSQVGSFNYGSYYKDEDVFREKVLEGYGYKFLRINRFNVSKKPIETLDQRIRSLIKNTLVGTNPAFIKDLQNIVADLEDGNLKECSKCGKLRELSEFQDSKLISGTGRVCRSCKRIPAPRKRERTRPTVIPTPKATGTASSNACPKCGGSMRERSGRYGRFLSCNRFPACRGSRDIA